MELTFKLAGVKFANEDGTKRQVLLCKLYDDYFTESRESEIMIAMRPEPDNPADPNAVAVYVARPKEARGRIGFVPRDQAEEAATLLRQPVPVARLVDMKIGGKSGTVSAVIRLRTGR